MPYQGRRKLVNYRAENWAEQQRALERERKLAGKQGVKARAAELRKEAAKLAASPERVARLEPIKLSASHPAYRPYRPFDKKPFRTYRMSMNEIAAMHAAQEGKCANPGCAVMISVFGPTRAVDHDHTTGKVRGILCKQCNVGLGMFRDDPRRLVGALAYLGFIDIKLLKPDE